MVVGQDTSGLKCAVVALFVLNLCTILALVLVAIRSSKVDDGSIGTVQLAALSITEGKIGTGAVSMAKIGTDAVSREKLNGDVVGFGLAQSSDGSLKIDAQAGVAAANKAVVLDAAKSVDTFRAQALQFGSTSAVTFPTGDGTNGQVLKTNGAGQLSWGSCPCP